VPLLGSTSHVRRGIAPVLRVRRHGPRNGELRWHDHRRRGALGACDLQSWLGRRRHHHRCRSRRRTGPAPRPVGVRQLEFIIHKHDPVTRAAVDANPAVSSCSARTLSADLANGGSIPDIAASCKLPPGTYTATAHMYDVTGKITTSKRQFVVYPPSTYHPVTPVRVLDTRKSIGLSGKLKAGVARTFQITGLHGIPAGATAITANATVVQLGAASSIYLGPAPIAKPSTYTLSFNKGQVANRGVTVALSPAGALSVTYRASSGTTDLVLDVTGYFSPRQAATHTTP